MMPSIPSIVTLDSYPSPTLANYLHDLRSRPMLCEPNTVTVYKPDKRAEWLPELHLPLVPHQEPNPLAGELAEPTVKRIMEEVRYIVAAEHGIDPRSLLVWVWWEKATHELKIWVEEVSP